MAIRCCGCFKRVWQSRTACNRISLFIILAAIVMTLFYNGYYHVTRIVEWHLLFWYGLFFLVTTQISKSGAQFFKGEGSLLVKKVKYFVCGIEEDDEIYAEELDEQQPRKEEKPIPFWVLMPATFAPWLFSRSLRDACFLTSEFGIFAGIAYSGWFSSLVTVALVSYYLRTGPFRFRSLSQAIHNCYGFVALLSFYLAVLYRLYNEVWSNIIILASFYGPLSNTDPATDPSPHTKDNWAWWLSVSLIVFIPLVYTMVGGMRVSMMSGLLHTVLMLACLGVVLWAVHTKMPGAADGIQEVFQGDSAQWTLSTGGDLWLTSLLQGMFSYGFHDPILTDRAFVSPPRTMLWSFAFAALLGGLFLIAFATLGGLAKQQNIIGEPAVIGWENGHTLFGALTVLFLCTTLASLSAAFAAAAKLVATELAGFLTGLRSHGDPAPLNLKDDVEQLDVRHRRLARLAMLLLAVVAVLSLLGDLTVLEATLLSGTTVMGLGPPMFLLLFWRENWKLSPLAFHLPMWAGVFIGILYQMQPIALTAGATMPNWYVTTSWWSPTQWELGSGNFRFYLGMNFWGLLICVALCVLGFFIDQFLSPHKIKGPQTLEKGTYASAPVPRIMTLAIMSIVLLIGGGVAIIVFRLGAMALAAILAFVVVAYSSLLLYTLARSCSTLDSEDIPEEDPGIEMVQRGRGTSVQEGKTRKGGLIDNPSGVIPLHVPEGFDGEVASGLSEDNLQPPHHVKFHADQHDENDNDNFDRFDVDLGVDEFALEDQPSGHGVAIGGGDEHEVVVNVRYHD